MDNSRNFYTPKNNDYSHEADLKNIQDNVHNSSPLLMTDQVSKLKGITKKKRATNHALTTGSNNISQQQSVSRKDKDSNFEQAD